MRGSSSWFCQATRIFVLSASLPGCAAHTSGSLSRPQERAPEVWCDLDVPAGASLWPLPAYEEMHSPAHPTATPRRPPWVVVWASWCEPCRAELPRMEAALDEAHRRGIELDVILLSIDDDVGKLANFVRDGPAFMQRVRILRATSADSFDAWAKRFALESSSVSLPIHLLANSDGAVTCMHTGALKADDVEVPGKLLSR
jgi:thiol-disulfide isomerase/thioredoxin